MAQDGYFSLLQQGIVTQKVNSVTNTTTTSGTDSVLITITPSVAGSYLGVFVGTMMQNQAGQSITTSFYLNGVQDATTVVDAAPVAGGLLSGSVSVPWLNIGGPYTLSTTGTLAIEWHVSGGTGTAQQRQLYIVKVG